MALTFQLATTPAERASAEALADTMGQGDYTRQARFVVLIMDGDTLAGYCGFTPGRMTDVGGIYLHSMGLDTPYRGQGTAAIVALCKWLVANYSPDGVFCCHAAPGGTVAAVIEARFNPVKVVQDNGLNFYWSSKARLGW